MTTPRLWFLLASLAAIAPAADAPPRRHADSGRGKFIPTFAIMYGPMKGARPVEETAKFDLLVATTAGSRLWRSPARNSWLSLKSLNPGMVIVVYIMGPGEYNVSSWGELGEGWEWMKRNHGNDAEDRWTARGVRHGTYLQGRDYPNERLMNLGKPDWQEYWISNVYGDIWGGRKKLDLEGVDGLFSDNTHYGVPWAGRWYREGSPDMPDDPVEYFEGGKYRHDRWRANTNEFFRRAIPWFAGKGLTFTHNFESLGKHADWWRELDSLPSPPFATMDEGGFICPWGSGEGRFFTWDWEARVRAMRDVRNTRILMTAHARVPEREGLEKMDVPDSKGMTGWDALWFSMTSFLLGYDDVARNAYMNFTVWGYSGYFYLDEFEPRYLHLGKAKGEFQHAGPVYWREFEDGYAVVNPGTQDAKNVEAPAANVRVLNHANFRSPGGLPEVSRFDLPAHRGAILLKHGHKAGKENYAGN